jgi:lipid II:glycine glycyltransferase (peptidoglycan interpeptide bridge formation enzyme)
MILLNRSEWDAFLADFPQVHLLQTGAWGDLKSAFGWEAVRLAHENTGAQVLFRRLPLGLSVAYLPKGPVGKNWQAFWPALDALCRQKKAIFLKVEPDGWEPLAFEQQIALADFRPDAVAVQPRRSIVIDLHGNENDWLARMSKKTRACFRTAEKGGVIARHSDQIQKFFDILTATGERDTFGVHSLAYYQKAYQLFADRNEVSLILAEREGQILAGLMVFATQKRAWYLYAASYDELRELNPTYLIQLEAMRWAAQKGCHEYDLYGIPDFDEETLEAQFTERRDGLWGVYGYKRKFGGKVVRSPGAYERVYIPVLYGLYQFWLNRRGGMSG